MARYPTRRFTRLEAWQGQTLSAADFREQLANADALRAAHNQALHESFGVSFGLAVTLDGDAAKVACGLAYDCRGRELVLQQDRSIKLPRAPAGEASLLVLGRRRAESGPVEEGTELRWVPAARYRAKLGVPLARYTVSHDRLDEPTLDAFRVLGVRALARLPMGTGSLEGVRISWEPIADETGLQVRVDTTTAGFVSDCVVYFASLLWEKPNERFAPPFASVILPSARAFTLRLLFPPAGAESFAPLTGAGLVSEAHFRNGSVEFDPLVQFGEEEFTSGDVVARLDPRSDRAWPLKSSAGGVLTLEVDDENDEDPPSFAEGDLLVAANVPRSVTVQRVFLAFRVDVRSEINLNAIRPGSVVARQDAYGAGSAARVVARRKSRLWLDTELSGTKLALVGEPYPIESIEDGVITIDGYTPPPNAGVLRLGAPGEAPAVVAIVAPDPEPSDGSFKLDRAIELREGDLLQFADFDEAFTVAPVEGASVFDTYEVDKPGLLTEGDVVRRGDDSYAIVVGIDNIGTDSPRVTLSPGVGALVGDVLEIGDITARSTLLYFTEADGPRTVAAVGEPGRFQRDDVVVRVGARASVSSPGVEAEVTVVDQIGLGPMNDPVIYLNPAFADASSGDVLAVVRFARRSRVVEASSPRRVRVEQPNNFAAGDTVAQVVTAGATVLSVVERIEDSTLVLRTPMPGLTTSDTLAVVALRNVSAVTDGGESPSVDPAENFRSGDLVGRFTHWSDASRPALLDDDEVEPWLDGLLVRDAVGFAALSDTQRTLRFVEDADLTSDETLNLAGPHVTTGVEATRRWRVDQLVGQRATFTFTAGTGQFRVRPEQLRAMNVGPEGLSARFATYALERGLRIAWFGVQLPGPAITSCPLHAPEPCGCCSEEPPPSPTEGSGCCQ
ncbi:hypothetical protein [Sorangium sp. So ce341]|uniref:hypothetical protein n=1 Tax=Sorangium sp. So ce341 TaxID=3133302 RepID=UPI003F625427